MEKLGITIRFERAVFEKLRKTARKENRSFNNYIQTIVVNAIEGAKLTHV